MSDPVVTPERAMVNILRVDRQDGAKAAVLEVSDGGRKLNFDPRTGFIDFPGGAKKFSIRHDPKSGYYWTLANWVPPRHQGHNAGSTRNTLALVRSKNLRDWTVRSVLLYHPDRAKHGFQYPDWHFEGDDIVAVCRTAYDDGLGGAHNAHDANFMTFHRFENFRQLTAEDSPKPLREAVREAR
jgi:hypothetical protein